MYALSPVWLVADSMGYSHGVTGKLIISSSWEAYTVERRLHMQCGVAWPSQSNSQVSCMEETTSNDVFCSAHSVQFESPVEHFPLAKIRPQTPPYWIHFWQGEPRSDRRCLQEALYLSKWEDRPPVCGLPKPAQGERDITPLKQILSLLGKWISCWTTKQWWSILLNPIDFCPLIWRAQSCPSLCFRAAPSRHRPSSLLLDVWRSLKSPSASGCIYL